MSEYSPISQDSRRQNQLLFCTLALVKMKMNSQVQSTTMQVPWLHRDKIEKLPLVFFQFGDKYKLSLEKLSFFKENWRHSMYVCNAKWIKELLIQQHCLKSYKYLPYCVTELASCRYGRGKDQVCRGEKLGPVSFIYYGVILHMIYHIVLV